MAVINMLKAVMKKVDIKSMHEKMAKFSLDMETIGKELVEIHK